MKKTLAMLLSVCLLLGAASVLAEDTTIEITFDGTYLEDENFGYQIYLPNEWIVAEDENYYFLVHNEDETQMMAIDVFELDGETVEAVAEGVASDDGYAVAALSINGIPFYLYEAAEAGVFGAFTGTADGAHVIHFIFSPQGDAEFEDLAMQIMASITAT